MDAAALDTAVDRRHYISVSNQVYAGPGFPRFTNNLFMAFPVQNNHRQIGNFTSHRICHIFKIFSNRGTDINPPLRTRTHADFLHIHVRSMKQTPFRSDSKNSNSTIFSFCYKVCSFYRIHRNIHFFPTLSYMFTNVQHGGFINLTLANDHGTGNRR